MPPISNPPPALGADLFPYTRFLRASRWHSSGLGTNTVHQLITDLLYCTPFYTPIARTVDKMAVHVTTAADQKKIRLGIYQDDGASYPDILIADAGEISTTTTGLKQILGLSIPLQANVLYWLASISDGTPSIASSTVGSSFGILGFSTTLQTGASGVWNVTFVYGALPATYPVGASASFVNMHKIALSFA